MVADIKPSGPLAAGTYIIRCVQAFASPMNLVRREEGKKPAVTNWKTVKSPTERWIVEYGEKGYCIRNASANLYMSVESGESISGQPVLGLQHAVEWELEKKEDEIYHVKLATNPKVVLDLTWFSGANGSEVIICDDFHGGVNQQWSFEKVQLDEEQSPCTTQLYIGPVPAGVYWLGQPYGKIKSPDGVDIKWNRAPSTIALGATACLPLGDDERAYAHLSVIGKGPFPHQIWALEPARHGYRLRNISINAYLNYIHSEPVLESISPGPSAIYEWDIFKDPGYIFSGNVPTWLIRPCADLNIAIGISEADTTNKLQLRAKTMEVWLEERKNAEIYRRWRFEPVEEKYLDTSFVSASVAELLRRPYV